MYEAIADPYCYPHSEVLRNLAGLRSQTELEKFEKFKVAQRSDEPLPVGRLSYTHYRAIHRHLFQDVYRWAGRIRTVRVARAGNLFCLPEHIDHNMRRIFEALDADRHLRDLLPDAFAEKAAHFVSELNAIHPFREGNGRTQNAFLKILADQGGHPLDFERLDPPELLAATIAALWAMRSRLQS